MNDFARLHRGVKPLLLPNIWDAVSARIVEDAGYKAVATSSAAVAWSLGYADGEDVPPAEMFAAVARIVRCVRVPVTADIEAGYAGDTDGLLRTIDAIVHAGAAGINLEDYDARSRSFFPIAVAAQRIGLVKRHAGDALFVNARTDLYLRDEGDVQERPRAVIERLQAFAHAGADGVFVPGLTDVATIAHITSQVAAPLNVLAEAGTPPLLALQRARVARVSFGSWPARRILGLTRRLAREIQALETFDMLDDREAIAYTELNALFEGKR